MTLTKKDLQEIGKLVTDITSVLNDALRKELQTDIFNLREEVKDDIYRFKDEILGEIQDFRDDMQVTKGYGDRIENHEERISALEQPIAN